MNGWLESCGFPALHVQQDAPARDTPWYKCGVKVENMLDGSGAIVCLIGGRGTGKTQMATDLARSRMYVEAPKNYIGPALRGAKYLHVMDFFLTLKRSFAQGSTENEADLLRKWIDPAFLVIDEIQERSESEWENRTLTYLIDKRYGMKRDTLLLANVKPSELLTRLGASIVSRMQETGGIVECNWPSFRGGAK